MNSTGECLQAAIKAFTAWSVTLWLHSDQRSVKTIKSISVSLNNVIKRIDLLCPLLSRHIFFYNTEKFEWRQANSLCAVTDPHFATIR